MARRKVRIDLLQEIFDPVVSQKDASFFIRLNESDLHLEDKSVKSDYPLFNDKGFTDKEYYKKFPTIYHLRYHLLNNEEKDIRLIYLACHHLIKYRGHFLFPNFNTNRGCSGFENKLKEINEFLLEQSFEKLFVENNLENSLDSIINDKSKSDKQQWDEIKEKLNPTNDKKLNSVFTAIRGNKISLSKIWEDLDEAEKEIKEELKDFKFSSDKYEECLIHAEEILNDDQLTLLELLKQFYDLIQLNRIVAGSSSIAEAMVHRYEEHKADLKLLKKFIKTHLPDEYDKMFRKNIDFVDKGHIHASYVNYVGSNITHNRKSTSHSTMCVDKNKEPVTADYSDFLKYTKALLEKAGNVAKTSEEYLILLDKIEQESLCKIHNTQENSYIPYQLQEAELKAILKKQQNNFEFLKKEAGKILSLLTFRIPYYVGPLNEAHKDIPDKFAWIEKLPGFEKQKVLPWNFEKVVDAAKSGENFITRMTAKCTYLPSEDVIPKQSLLYQKYMLFQDLNNLKINGNRITQDLKMFLYNSICQKETSLTKTKIKKHLENHGKITKKDSVGKENENDLAFNSSISSYIKLKNIIGNSMNDEMCENIIKWHTVFGDEKRPVQARIKRQYGKELSEEQIAKLSKLSFKGWARFSSKFLNGITTTDQTTGETGLTIIKILEETTQNLIEILNSDNYFEKFQDIVEKEMQKLRREEIDYGYVSDLYCSPTVKRSIWQAVLISKELMKINGGPPSKVFIEVTRGTDKKQKGKMKSSRRKQIENILDKMPKETSDLTTLKRELAQKKDEKEFRSDRLFLYFTQLGKCMYSGEKIELSDLNNYNLYDIDHIYPQSKIKDDSLTNRVLVKRSANAHKSDTYPIEYSIQKERKDFWSFLRSKNLITNEKYNRLICSQPLTQSIIGGFINRQLVSTNQAVKETTKALRILFGFSTDSRKIVYSKAANVSEFRNTYDLIKSREVNNLHHAHDAYLNIIVGNVWDSVYGRYWSDNFTFNENNALDRLFKYDHKEAWKVSYIEKIKAYLFDNKKYLDKFLITTRPFEKKGEFYDQTIHPKGKAQFELHKGYDTEKYGGYKNANTAYNCLIEYDGKKDERVRGIFSVPVRFAHLKTNELLAQIAEENGITDKKPKVLMPKIQLFSVLEVDGIRYHMRSGISDNKLQCSVTVEWYPDKDIIQIVRDIFKFKKLIDDKNFSKETVEEWKETPHDIEFATRERNKNIKEGKKISRENNLKLYDAIIEQIKKPFYQNYPTGKKVREEKILREKFEILKTFSQMEQLVELLNVITMNKANADTTNIGGVKYDECKYKISGCNNVTSKNIILITQSPTGLFENKIAINLK